MLIFCAILKINLCGNPPGAMYDGRGSNDHSAAAQANDALLLTDSRQKYIDFYSRIECGLNRRQERNFAYAEIAGDACHLGNTSIDTVP